MSMSYTEGSPIQFYPDISPAGALITFEDGSTRKVTRLGWAIVATGSHSYSGGSRVEQETCIEGIAFIDGQALTESQAVAKVENCATVTFDPRPNVYAV